MPQTISPFVPALWTNQTITLFHGTIEASVNSILNHIDVAKGKANRDFGRGFYTTTVLRQGQSWAWQQAQRQTGSFPKPLPAIVAFDVERSALAQLDLLWFVRGSYEASDFWSFVFHCRQGTSDHCRNDNQEWYDVVVGPVSASWKQRLAIYDADQISFHTQRAAALLDASNARRVL